MSQLLCQQPPTIVTSPYGRCCFAQSILAPQFATTVLSWPQQVTAASHRRCTFKCMANPRRVKMVANQTRREISDMLLTDKVLQFAVLPEAALGADRYLSSLTTISDVEVSGDLQVIAILDKIKKENEEKEARSQADNQHESSNKKDEDGENWEDDDPSDDGIIYVQ